MNNKLKAFYPIADMISATFGSTCEVTIHDLSQPETSVIYVAGQVTGRKIGQSFNHLIKQVLLNDEYKDGQTSNYIFQTPDHKTIKSSTAFIKEDNVVIGAICINLDISIAQQFYQEMAPVYGIKEKPVISSEIETTDDVTSIIDNLINTITERISITEMNRKKAVKLIKFMDDKGIFLVKGAIDKVASKLGVSKVTIYSYLDEAKGKR